ncbi:MAG: Gfo/Idh/MocA family oxidoreductase [Candidatus Berkelbacteria bacterium]
MNAAVIGIGNMGKHHARNYSEIQDVDLVAVADLNEELGQETAERFGCKYYKNYQEMLDNEKIDVITIAVPTKYHKDVALACIEKGINILLEKPIAATVEEAKEVVTAAKAKNVKFTVGHIERFNPAVIKLKELIDKGELGDIVSIRNTRIGPMPTQIKDANVVIDIGVHDIDLINWMLGKLPTEIMATGGNALNKIRQDYVDVFLKYGNVSGAVQANWITPAKVRRMSVCGTKAYVELNFITQELVLYETKYSLEYDNFGEFIIKFGEPKEGELIAVDNIEPLNAEICAFIKAIKEDTRPVMTADEAIEALDVACKVDTMVRG